MEENRSINNNRGEENNPQVNTIKSIFPRKLWRMINDRRFNSAIKWTEDGQSFFVYENPLRNLCLGKENNIFFTKQPKSFIRQLHLYGFRKINKNQFMHKFFQRGHPDLLRFIKRTYKTSTLNNQSSSSSSDHSEGSENVTLIGNNCQFGDYQQQIPGHCSDNNTTTSTSTVSTTFGAITLIANNYDVASQKPTSDWCECNYDDVCYNYNDDSVLTLYNNDIYPDTGDDNNITL